MLSGLIHRLGSAPRHHAALERFSAADALERRLCCRRDGVLPIELRTRALAIGALFGEPRLFVGHVHEGAKLQLGVHVAVVRLSAIPEVFVGSHIIVVVVVVVVVRVKDNVLAQRARAHGVHFRARRGLHFDVVGVRPIHMLCPL